VLNPRLAAHHKRSIGGDKHRFAVIASLLVLAFLVVLLEPAAAEEISLLDSDGSAVAYVDVDDGATIFLWSGKPVAYFAEGTSGNVNVWGFNGKHLGWLTNGVLRDNDGYAACVFRSAYNGLAKLEGLKGLKELKPLKALKELEPLKPLNRMEFSETPCSVQLLLGVDD
jgi:hypothetical protein